MNYIIWLHNGRYGFDYQMRVDANYNVSLTVLSEPAIRYQAEGKVKLIWENETTGMLHFYDMTDDKGIIEPFKIDVLIQRGNFKFIDIDYYAKSMYRFKLSTNPIFMCYQNKRKSEAVYFYDRKRLCNVDIEQNKIIKRSQSVRELKNDERLSKYIWEKN